MRRRFSVVIILLATIPTLAFAQRGGNRGRGSGNGGKSDDKYAPTNDMAKYPAAVELQKFNPVVYLIDNRKKLSLSDSLVTTLRVLQGQIYERNGDLIARYDDIQRVYKPENANDASDLSRDSARVKALQQTHIMNAVFDTLMSRRQDDDLEALALLVDEKQKKKAAELLDKQDAEFAKLAPRGAAPRGRRRPSAPAR